MQKSIKLPKMNQNRLKEIILTPIIFKDPAELNFASNPTMRTTTPVKIVTIGRMRRKTNLNGFIRQWQSLQSFVRSTIAVFNFFLFEARLLTTWNYDEFSRMQLNDLNALFAIELSENYQRRQDENVRSTLQTVIKVLYLTETELAFTNSTALYWGTVKWNAYLHSVDFHIRRLESDIGRSSLKVSCLFKQYFVTSRVNTFILIH